MATPYRDKTLFNAYHELHPDDTEQAGLDALRLSSISPEDARWTQGTRSVTPHEA